MDLMNQNAQEFGPPGTQDANHNHFHQQQQTIQPSPTFPTSPLPTPTLLASPLAPVQLPLPSPIGELAAPGPLPRCSTPPSEPGPSTSSIKHVPTATGLRMGRPPGTYKKAVFEIDPTCQKPVIVKDRSSRLAKSRDTPSPDPDEENLDVEPVKECKWGECDRTFSTHSALIEHFRRVHHPQLHATKDRVLDKFSGTMERVWYCKWRGGCNRTEPFRASYMLVVHARSHTGDKPNRCPYDDCNKAYSRLENLKVHVRSHTGDRPYICQFPGCMKACSSSADRNKHQKRTHSDEKPYLCMVGSCKKRYTDPSSVRKHIKTVHGEEEYERVKKNRVMNLDAQRQKHRMDHFHKRQQMAAEVIAYQEAMRQRRIEEQRPHFPMPNPPNCSFQTAMRQVEPVGWISSHASRRPQRMDHFNMRQQMAAEVIAYQEAMRQRRIEEQRPHFAMPNPQNCSFQAVMHHVDPVFHGSGVPEYPGQRGVGDYYEPFCRDTPSLDVANEPGHFPGMGDDYLDRYGLPSPNNVPDVPDMNSLAGSMSYSC